MKRLIFALAVLMALGALMIWGNRLLGRTLDAELGSRLSKQLGLPVTLAPIQAHLLQLKAASPKLVMGDPRDPAVVATGVVVTLAWDNLLRGEIRLVRVSATDLMLRPSRWPSSGTPPPDDYRFLDQWIPRSLQLASARYVSDSGDAYPVSQLQWRRQADGSATAQWSEARAAGNVSLSARLKSLEDLLRLAPVELALDVEVEGRSSSPIALKISVQPATTSAYSAQIDIEAAGMTAHITATGQTPWRLPDQSETTIPLLATDPLRVLVDSYRTSGSDDEPATELAAALPPFRLPTHAGHVAIAELRIAAQIGRDTAFDFTTGEHGVQISALTSKGPESTLSGKLAIISDDRGWAVDMDATILARDVEAGGASQYTGADWSWRTGHAGLTGSGETWESLLNSLSGDLSVAGYHRGEVDTPISIDAQLDNRPDEFALERMAVTLGEGQLSGSAKLSGKEPRKLTLDIKGTRIDVGFLFTEKETEKLPGMALPEYLGFLPDLDLNLAFDIEELRAPGLSLSQANATLERTALGGRLVASTKGAEFGTLDLTLAATTPPDKPADVQLTANFSQLDIAGIFRQQGLIHSHSTGSLTLRSQGRGMKDVFTAMQGQAKVAMEIRSDNNWRRTASAQEKLALSGSASLVLDADRIVGVKVDNLDITSIDQDLTGSLSLVSDRTPWLVADLKSKRLNVTGLLALLPQSTQQADQAGLVPSLERLGATKISLNANSLTVEDVVLSDVRLALASAPNLMTIEQFDFVSEDLTLKTQGKITWTGQRATLETTAQLTDVDLDQFLINYPDVEHVPVSGSLQLHSEGSQIDELISNVTGYITLEGDAGTQGNSPQARRQLTVRASRLADGVQADITSLQWGESEIVATVSYHRTTPPSLEVKINGGNLSLLPWENAHLENRNRAPARDAETKLDAMARASADLVSNILLTPLRFLGSDDTAPPSTRVFSADPLPLDGLKKFNMNLSGQLDSLLSTEISAKQLEFTSRLNNGQLELKVGSGQISGGSGELALALDSSVSPPSFNASTTFQNVSGINARATFPRSGFASLQSRGSSQAELAGNVSGLVFLDLGRGPFDYANSAFLTANVATTIFQTLIPGISRQQQQLECGTVLGLFQNGQGETPYGFAARTNQANLVGHLKVDLTQETLEMNIDSRGRQGIGLSVGSVFSNTVQIRGPLNNPRIVPNATGIAWRAWAAVTTGGLSILGESVLRRIWASENACNSVKRLIVENVCPTNTVAASSQMVCPKP